MIKVISSKMLLVLTLIAPTAWAQSQIEGAINDIDSYLQSSVSMGFAGSVLIAKDDKIELEKGYGLANRVGNVPVTESTVFNLGSITKQFTAAAILKLVEQGAVELSEPISSYLDGVPEEKSNITLHQLLTHTAGISPYAEGYRYDYVEKEEFLQNFYRFPLIDEPGNAHVYANAGYIVLAAIIEAASGMKYEQFLRDYFFDPLEMNSTGYKLAEWSDQQLAHSYFYSTNDNNWIDWGTTPDNWLNSEVSWNGIGKGDIHSNVIDLYKWHRALKNNTVLSREMIELMESPHVSEGYSSPSYYGYGWAIFNSERDTKVVSHNGSNFLYFGDFKRYVDEDTVIIYLTNVPQASFRSKDDNRPMDSENLIEIGARELERMLFRNQYNPVQVPRQNIHELVFDFIQDNSPDQISSLNTYIQRQRGSGIGNPSLLNSIGLQLMREGDTDWSIALLKLNVEIFPEDGNLWDSLGEGYLGAGNEQLAVESFAKALKLAPETNCYWCENSRRLLNQITTN